jgi:hypothetical protein
MKSIASFRRHLGAADFIVRLGAVLWAIWLMVPWTPKVFDHVPRDGAYLIFSHIAFAQGEPWGTTALHTAGPLGFLRFHYFYPATHPLLLLASALVAVAAALLADEIVRWHMNTWARFTLVAAVIWILSVGEDAVWLFLLLVSQVLLPRSSRQPNWSLWPDIRWLAWPLLLDLVACAIAANAKGSFFMMSAVLAVELAVLELWARRAPVFSASLILLVVIVARLSGMRASDWGPYLRHLIDSLRGYPESFSEAGSLMQACVLISSVLTFLALATLSSDQLPRTFDRLVRWTALAMLVWMDAKAALTRQDLAHEIRAIMSIGALLAVYAAAHRHEWGIVARTICLMSASGLAIALLLATPGGAPMEGTGSHITSFASFWKYGTADTVAKDAQAQRYVSEVITKPWPPASSVAAFGSYQSLLLGHPGRRVTLPIAASYEIWSPWTSRRERAFLMGPDAPDYLVYTSSPMSAELAVALTRRYVEIGRGEHYRLLQRRPLALRVRRRVVFDGTLNAWDRLEIPSAWQTEPAVAEIRYTKTLPNLLISALYQPPEAFVVFFRGETPFAKVRINGLLSGEGIVLGGEPGVWDARPRAIHGMRFGSLTEKQLPTTALGFEARGAAGNEWNRYFHPAIRLHVYVPEFR